jgi:putative ABC transport system permease protein
VTEVKYLGLDQPDDGTVYWPMTDESLSRFLVVRSAMDPEVLATTLQRVVRELDPSVPLSGVRTMEDLVAQSLERPQSLSLLVAGFAVVALVLSIVGISGVMGYYVQEHLREIGIRVALGGTPADVARLVIGHGMRVVVAGVAIGGLAASALTRWMSGLLFGVSTSDARTFAGTIGMLLLVALAACLLPARRAAAAQPAVVLRND